MPNRHASTDSYRYGFQGQEKDDELKGEGNSLNYTFRMHDPRVGRFFAVDPLFREYPHNSPYAFSENEVISFTELEGAEKSDATTKAYTVLTPATKTIEQYATKELAKKALESTVEGQGKQFVKKQATKKGAIRILGTVTKSIGTVFIFLTSTSAHAPTRNPFPNQITDFKLKVDEKLAVPDLTIKEKTTDELPIVRIGDVRKILARAFYEKYEGKLSQINGINFANKVFTRTIDEKSVLYQWTINGKLGDYFTDSPSSTNLGLPQMPDGTPAYWDDVANAYKTRTLVKIVLPVGSSTKGLQSTSATVDSWDPPGGKNIGGDTQIYAPEIKNMNPSTTTQ